MSEMPQPRPSDWAAVVALGFIWGASFLANKLALEDLGTVSLVAIRLAGASLILLAVVFATGRALPATARAWAFVAGFAIFSNVLPFTLINWSLAYVTSAYAGVAQATLPLFVLVMAIALVPGERFAWHKLAGILVGFVGVVLLIGPENIFNDTAGLVPRLACVGAALCYAIGGILTRLAPKIDQIAYSAFALGIAAALTTPVALISEGMPAMPGPIALASVIFLILGPTALAAILLVRTIRSAGPVFVTLLNYMVPVWSVVLGALVLSEALPPGFLLAAVVILTGLAISQAPALFTLAKMLRGR